MEEIFKSIFDDTLPELQPGYHKIYEIKLSTNDDKDDSTAAIIVAGIGNDDPIEFIDSISADYQKNNPGNYTEYVEISFTNVWVRVLIKNLDHCKFEKFDPEKHRL